LRRYLSTFFIMDVASTIPFQGLAYLITGEVREGAAYSLLGVLRLWRLRTVKQFFTRLEKDIRFSYFWVRCARLVAVGNHTPAASGLFKNARTSFPSGG
jgi:hypothetical protein